MYRPRPRRQALRLGLIAALVGLALSACGGGGQDANKKKSESGGSAPTNGQIAFRRYLDPDQTKSALFTMNPDGSHIRQIAQPPNSWRDDDPVWSPDGTKVAFHRQRFDEMMSRIMVLNHETGDVREVTHCGPDQGWTNEQPPPSSGHYCVADFYPAWAPDGNSISFRRILGPDKDCCRIEGIWSIGLDGSDLHQVTNVDPKLPQAFSDWGSAFSPNGKLLVFERVRSADESHAVFVQPIDSSGSAEDAQQLTPWQLNCQDHPEFSPDGKLVLFRCLPEGEEGPSNLYWVHPDGTGLHQLTHAPADEQYLGSNFSPSFSAGEGWIAVGRTGGYGDEGNADVFRMRVEGGDVVREVNLTKSAIWDSNPNWSSHQAVG